MTGVIVNLAPTGMIPTRRMSPHVPITPEEIIADVLTCAAAGANVVHLHARDEQGAPTYRRDVYARIIEGIRAVRPDLVLGVSLSGRTFTEFDQRADPLLLSGDAKPDLGSLTLSSLNFADGASVNSPDLVRRLAATMAERGIKPELEVFDPGMVTFAEYLRDKGELEPPLYYNLILGNVAGAQPTPAHVAALTSGMAGESVWTCGGIGRTQPAALAVGMTHGGGVRVGLEDNIWADQERTRAATNAELVGRAVAQAGLLGRTVADPAQVRESLGVSG